MLLRPQQSGALKSRISRALVVSPCSWFVPPKSDGRGLQRALSSRNGVDFDVSRARSAPGGGYLTRESFCHLIVDRLGLRNVGERFLAVLGGRKIGPAFHPALEISELLEQQPGRLRRGRRPARHI